MRFGSVVALGLLLTGGIVQAQPPRAEDLAIQAREVLRRYCVECHDGGPQSKADLNVLDHAQLVAPLRRLVMPQSPTTSRLLELIEDGSMPQDIRRKLPEPERQTLRAWVAAGAPPVTRAHSDAYVLSSILADARALGPGDRLYARYLSLNHLLTGTGPQTDLEVYRAALVRLVQHLAKPGLPTLTALEPTETVFRLDLRGLGWQTPVLTRNRPPLKPEPLNRFDLVLLEYPGGVLPEPSALTATLGQEFLSQVPQVRPLPYVRADWFVSRALEAIGLPPVKDPAVEQARKRYNTPLGLAEVQAELDWPRTPAELRETFSRPPFAGTALAPLGQDGTVSRAAWEKSFASVVRQLKLGTPMLALDGLTWPDHQPEPPVAVEISTRAPDGPKKSRFAVQELMAIDIESQSNKLIIVEVVWINAEGKMYVLPMKAGNRLKPGERVELAPKDKKGFEVSPPTGKDQLILFAFEVDAPEKGDDGFPSGELFSGESEKDRFVHRFYEGWYDRARKVFDPARVLKRTIVLDIVERGKP